MKNVIAGAVSCSNSNAPTLHLATFRRNILAVVLDNPLFTDAEQLRSNHNAHECTCPYRLVRWLKNVRRVAAEREHAQGIASLAEGIELFEQRLAAGASAPAATAPAEQPELATGSQLNRLKMAAWELPLTDMGRDMLFERILAPDLTRTAAADLLAALEAANAVPTPKQWATPAQCDEIHQLTTHPVMLACEKAQVRTALPTLTQVGAVRLIGKLWGKVLHRTGQVASSDGSTSYRA
ncbi:MAG: hypothetical protein ACRYFX_10835 [Janthinobacterium lividum]